VQSRQLSLKDHGFTNYSIQQRCNQLTRELDGLSRSESIIRALDKRRSKSNPSVKKGTSNRKKQLQLPLAAFFEKVASSGKKRSVVEMSDTELEAKDMTDVSNTDVHVVEIEMSPKSSANGCEGDHDGLRLTDKDSTQGPLAGEKRSGGNSLNSPESIESPEKKQRGD
jgi:hypothetical protein